MTRTPPLPGEPERLSFKEVCAMLGREASSVYRYMDEGMPSYRVLGARVFRRAEVAEWVAEHAEVQ